MKKFDAIFKRFHQPLFLFCLKFVDEEDALDVVQDVFVVLWEEGKYAMEDEHVKSFLFHAVRNRCLNLLKHQSVVHKHQSHEKKLLARLELQFLNNGEKSMIEQETREKIFEAIDALPEIYRDVIVKSRFERLKNFEIAEKTGVSLRTVETRLYRALVKLRERLTKDQIFILFNLFSQRDPFS